mmetsp:Transcript_25023/g.68709  ORF Transcript_25023/g.68709 Transcript_25023/m.68709 type:complete len:222 (-) Transcript_25023:1739-2404(-)
MLRSASSHLWRAPNAGHRRTRGRSPPLARRAFRAALLAKGGVVPDAAERHCGHGRNIRVGPLSRAVRGARGPRAARTESARASAPGVSKSRLSHRCLLQGVGVRGERRLLLAWSTRFRRRRTVVRGDDARPDGGNGLHRYVWQPHRPRSACGRRGGAHRRTRHRGCKDEGYGGLRKVGRAGSAPWRYWRFRRLHFQATPLHPWLCLLPRPHHGRESQVDRA